MSVYHDVPAAFDFRNSVQGETDELVERDAEVDDYEWHDHRVDEWSRQYVSGLALTQPFQRIHFQLSMCGQHRLFEADARAFQSVAELQFLRFDGVFQFFFEPMDLFQQFTDTRRHIHRRLSISLISNKKSSGQFSFRRMWLEVRITEP